MPSLFNLPFWSPFHAFEAGFKVSIAGKFPKFYAAGARGKGEGRAVGGLRFGALCKILYTVVKSSVTMSSVINQR